ncbi:MAG: lipopolysaccharide kinase InaA family protein [Desulfobacterales bacterium]|nr:lipopolysaccharide kinase InaA family protein [Desulfobacterales bacterium]
MPEKINMRLREIFHSEKTRDLLAHNGLGSFESLWKVDGRFIEEPNYGRGGRSGIILCEIRRADGQPLKIIIKRQENHAFRSLLHPLMGAPTFFREYKNIRRLEKRGIPAPEILFYGERMVYGNIQAVLAVRFLEGYRSLDEIFSDPGERNNQKLKEIIDSVATIVAQVHSSRLQHGCLYGKHIFIKVSEIGSPDVRLIDLEKMRLRLSRFSIAIHDLGALFRRAKWPGDSWKLFLQSYLIKAGLESKEKRLYKALGEKIEKSKEKPA